jgi:hypothetical protein
MNAAQKGGQSVWGAGYRYQVDMVRHETVGQDLNRMAARVLAEEVEIEAVPIGSLEHELAVIATLSDVMSQFGNYDSGSTRHLWILVGSGANSSQENSSVPFSPYSPYGAIGMLKLLRNARRLA